MTDQKQDDADDELGELGELGELQSLMATEFKAVMLAARGGMPDDRAYDWIANITPYLAMAVGITMIKGILNKCERYGASPELVLCTNYQHIQDALKKNYEATMNIRRACLEEFAPGMLPKEKEEKS